MEVWENIINEELENLSEYEQYERDQQREDIRQPDATEDAGKPATTGKDEGADTGAETQSDGSGRAPDGSQSTDGREDEGTAAGEPQKIID